MKRTLLASCGFWCIAIGCWAWATGSRAYASGTADGGMLALLIWEGCSVCWLAGVCWLLAALRR